MVFVPLPLFATILLAIAVIVMVATRDLKNRTNQLFTLLVALFAVQSLLLCLRWGYDHDSVGIAIAALAPTLPVCAYLAYLSLTTKPSSRWNWPLAVVVVNWMVLLLARSFADVAILLTYVGFGALILRQGRSGSDSLVLARMNRVEHAVLAMKLTGIALIASGLTDLFVLVDFIRTDGRNTGLTVTLAQSAVLLCIGAAALVGQLGAAEEQADDVTPQDTQPDETDAVVHRRLIELFENEALHHDTELNLRRLARRLGLPDRRVSRAVNRLEKMSVSQFVNTYRIRDACEMLVNTDQTILQISLSSGFLTKSNFNREFLRVTAQTPTQWRKANAAPVR